VKLVIHLDGSSIRGNESQLFAVARGLSARGHDVVVSCRAGTPVNDALERADIRTSDIRPAGDIAPLATLRFAKWLSAERPDAILLTSWRKVLVAGWAARNAGIPRIVLRVGGQHNQRRAVDRWKYRHALTHYCDAIIANSSVVAEHLLNIIPGLRPETVHQIANGMALSDVEPVSLRDQLTLDQHALLVMSTGGLDHRKGFDLLIHAVSRLDSRVHLAIAGEGNERAALETLAHSLGVENRVHLLGHRSDVRSLLPGVDLFVMSSRGEGMAVAMLEAMAASRPVVSTDVGGAGEALGEHRGRSPAGWIVPRNDIDALTETLHEVIALLAADPGSVEVRVEEAAWRMHNWFTIDRMVDEYERILLASD
jgi:glycosyltransferase involved in cell wall biosynthesis